MYGFISSYNIENKNLSNKGNNFQFSVTYFVAF